jgi:glycosyltransferase involved in cell wall biosynthesis
LKIVHTVESYLPAHHGMAEVVRQLSEGLVQLGHNVVVLTSFHPEREIISEINGVSIISFSLSGSTVKGIKGDSESYIDYLLNDDFDVLTNFAAQNWATDLCLPILSKIKAKLFFVPTGFSGLLNPSYKKYFENMPRWMSQYNSNVFLSTTYQDYKFASKNNITNKVIIPNGASFREFEQNSSNFNLRNYLDIHSGDQIILHVGSYTGIKGHDEAIDIFLNSKTINTHLVFIGQNFSLPLARFFRMHFNWFKEIWHLDAIRFRMFKVLIQYFKLIFSKKKNRIRGISLTRQELICALKQSDIFLFPSLIECSPIVIFEAMASSLPIIASPVGNIPEIIENSNSGKILKTQKTYNQLIFPDVKYAAQIVDQLLVDANSRKKMGASGYNYWRNNFTWENIVLKYESLYLDK